MHKRVRDQECDCQKKTCLRQIENRIEDTSQNVEFEDTKMENTRGKTDDIPSQCSLESKGQNKTLPAKLFTMAEIGKQPKDPLADERIKNM